MKIDDLGIYDKKVVSFDFHGTIIERHYHHKSYDIEKSTYLNRPVFDIFRRCLDKGIKTYIISFESINGSGDKGVANNLKILKKYGVDFPKENIFCTEFKSKDAWFEDLKVQFHVDDDIGVCLLAEQMGIPTLLVDYNDSPVSNLFNRINLNGKIFEGKL